MSERKRLVLVMPMSQYSKVRTSADERAVTVTNLVKRFISLGLYVLNHQDELSVFVSTEDGEKEIIFF